MNEGDFSKRDAFVLLEADYPIMMDTNQLLGHLKGSLRSAFSNPFERFKRAKCSKS